MTVTSDAVTKLSSYLACAIERLIVMLARAIFCSCRESCACGHTHVRSHVSGHGLYGILESKEILRGSAGLSESVFDIIQSGISYHRVLFQEKKTKYYLPLLTSWKG